MQNHDALMLLQSDMLKIVDIDGMNMTGIREDINIGLKIEYLRLRNGKMNQVLCLYISDFVPSVYDD